MLTPILCQGNGFETFVQASFSRNSTLFLGRCSCGGSRSSAFLRRNSSLSQKILVRMKDQQGGRGKRIIVTRAENHDGETIDVQQLLAQLDDLPILELVENIVRERIQAEQGASFASRRTLRKLEDFHCLLADPLGHRKHELALKASASLVKEDIPERLLRSVKPLAEVLTTPVCFSSQFSPGPSSPSTT